jgi:hypothetical protein
MSIDYDVSAGTNAVVFTFGADQTLTLRTTVRIIYEATAESTNETSLRALDNANTVLVSAVAPNGTATGQQTWEVNLVPVVSTLGAVRKIRLAIVDGGDTMGTGTILFDDISISSGTYSTCRSCHGEFLGKPYVAFTDGQQWNPDLHDVHRGTMLNFDGAPATRCPISSPSSAAPPAAPVCRVTSGSWLREDMGHDTISSGRRPESAPPSVG